MTQAKTSPGSFVAGNGYEFHCPVVDRDVKLIMCGFKKHKHWRGENFSAQDCRCAMNGSKCPAMLMMREEHRQSMTDDAVDQLYFDKEPTQHMLPKAIMDQIRVTVIMPMHSASLTLSPEQHYQLYEAKLVNKRVGGDVVADDVEDEVKKTRKPRAMKGLFGQLTSEQQAAVLANTEDENFGDVEFLSKNSGDMTILLNDAMEA